MECTICLEERDVFKFLDCNHYFCRQCVEDIAAGKVQAAATAKAATDPNSTTQNGIEENLPEEIECPTCRQKTPLKADRVRALRTKFTKQLNCRGCDKPKPIEEFR